MWLVPIIRLLAVTAASAQVTFAQCMFGAAFQKYTTFMYTPGFQSALGSLAGLRCTHPRGTHRPAGGTKSHKGDWTSSESAAFPSDLNAFLVEACLSLVAPPTTSPVLCLLHHPQLQQQPLLRMTSSSRRYSSHRRRTHRPSHPRPSPHHLLPDRLPVVPAARMQR